jgi:FecR protein
MFLFRTVAFGLLAAGWLLPLAAEAAPIADVTEVVNLATHQLPGQSKLQARLADPLLPDELLETAHEARLKVGFIDGSILVLEANSQAVLDRHLFDPAAVGRDAVDLNAGLFLFTSGGHGDEGLMLRTPVTIIDLRGTVLAVAVGLAGATDVTVIEGTVFLAPRGGGKGAMVKAGQKGRVASPDADVEVVAIAPIVPAAGSNHEQATSPGPDPATEPPGSGPPGSGPPGSGPSGSGPPGSGPPGSGSSPPGQNNGHTNNSGHADGTNPGKGDEHGHDNGGSNNPGD